MKRSVWGGLGLLWVTQSAGLGQALETPPPGGTASTGNGRPGRVSSVTRPTLQVCSSQSAGALFIAGGITGLPPQSSPTGPAPATGSLPAQVGTPPPSAETRPRGADAQALAVLQQMAVQGNPDARRALSALKASSGIRP